MDRRTAIAPGAIGAATFGVLLVTVAVGTDTSMKLVLLALAVGAPAALGLTRQPRNAAGWLLLVAGLVLACLGLAEQWTTSGHDSDWARWFTERSGAVVVPILLLALLLLPDGRLPSRRWRPWVVLVVAVQLAVIAVWSLVDGDSPSPNPAGVLPGGWAPLVNGIGDAVLQAPLLLAVAAVATRLRRDDGSRLVGLLWGAGGFALLSVAGHRLWPGAADALDVLGAALLGAGIATTLLVGRPVEAATPAPVSTPELSAREREVLELVTEGLTNREIAARLFISPVTARNHVSNILTKLDLENRTQAASWLSRRSTVRDTD